MTPTRTLLAVLAVSFCGLPAPAQEPLPTRAVKRLGLVQLRHGSRIQCLAYSPHGDILAAGGGADPVRLWDSQTGAELRRCDEPWVQALAFSPRGSVLATGGAYKVIRLFETATGKEVTAGKYAGHTAAVKALVFSPDGSMLVSGSIDGKILLWDLLTKKATETRPAPHADEITALAFSPDSDLIASAGNDRLVQVWSLDNNRQVHHFDAGCAPQALVFSRDGKTLFSAGDDNLIRVWNLDTGKLRDTLKGHENTVVSLLAARDGRRLISGGRDGTMRVWDLTGKTIVEARKIARDLGDSDALALSKDDKFLATAGINQTIRIFAADDGKEQTATNLPQAPLASLALGKDGKHLVTADTTGRIYLWDGPAGTLLRAWSCGQRGDIAVALSPTQPHVASGGDAVRLWDRDTGKALGELPRRDGDRALSLTFSLDGKYLAVGYRSKVAELFDLAQKKVVRTLAHPAPVYAVAFARDGSQVALGGGNKLTVYDAATGHAVKQLDSTSKEGVPAAAMPLVASLAFTPDGQQLVAGCYDALVHIYDIASGKDVRTCEGHVSVPYAIALSSDGRTLASASFDRTVRLWETFSGKPIIAFKGHVGSAVGVAFAPDDRTIYSAGADTDILVWNAAGPDGAPGLTLSAAELDAAWAQLADDDAARGQAMVWRLLAVSKEAVPNLARHVYLIDPARVDRLFGDLNSENYEMRSAAMKELGNYGMWMKGRLQDFVKEPGSLEVKRRAEQLLQKLNVAGAISLEQERLRLYRVMQILEHCDSPESRELFRKLAAQAPEPSFQADARAALARLGPAAGEK